MKLFKMHVSGLTDRSPLPITMLPAIKIQTTHTWLGTLSERTFTNRSELLDAADPHKGNKDQNYKEINTF